MDLPFSATDFFALFERYNAAIWPAQVLAYAAACGVLVLALARSSHAATAAAAVLAGMWLLNGIAYHLAFFSDINPAAFAFGPLFVLQAAMLAWHGIVRRSLRFHIAPTLAMAAGFVAVAYAMIIYPLLASAAGHGYPAAPVFGVAPCPTTIFTLGILMLMRPSAGWPLFVIPVAWAAIGGSAAVLLDVREDFGLAAAGLAALLVLAVSASKAAARKGSHEAHA